MEYLLYSGVSLRPKKALSAFNVNRISFRSATTVTDLGQHHLVVNAEVAQSPKSICSFMGSAFCNGTLVDNFTPISQAQTIEFCKAITSSPENVAGTYTCLIHDKLRQVTDIHFDDISSGPCFYATHGDGFAISNNIHMVAEWLRLQGVEPSRSIEPFLSDAAFGCGLMKGTLFEEISAVQPEHQLRVEDGLRVVRRDSIWPELMYATYEDLIRATAQRICMRMDALSNMGDKASLVIDFTGGMDSRMLVAALVHSGSHEQWSFNTLFKFPNPDGNFAEYLGEKLGMRRAKFHHHGVRRLSPYSKFCYELFHSLGTENKRGFYPNIIQPDVIRVHGGFGELGGKSQDTKRFYRGADKLGSPKTVISDYLKASRKSTEDVGFSQVLSAWAQGVLEQAVGKIIEEGHPIRAVPALFYRRAKARSHFGYIAHLRSLQTRYPSVLNDPYLTAAAIKAGPRKSMLGKVNFDIIRLLGGAEIAAMPLVLSRWQRGLFDDETDFLKYSKPAINFASDRLYCRTCPTLELPDAVAYPLQYREVAPGNPDCRVDRAIPRKFLISEHRHVVEEIRANGPIDEQIKKYLPETAVKAVVDCSLDSVEPTPANLNVLRFLTAAELWKRKQELPYYGDAD